MAAEGCFAVIRQAETSCLGPLLLREVLGTRVGEGDRVQESQLGVLGRSGEERLDLGAGPDPVAEVDQRRNEVRPNLGARLVLGEERTVHVDLLVRLRFRAEHRGFAEPSFEVVRSDGEHLVERAVGVRDEPEGEERSADPGTGGEESRFQLARLPVEAEGERGHAPVEPGPRPLEDPVELVGAGEESTRLARGGARLLAEVGLEVELAGQLDEPGALNERATAAHHVLRDRERKVARGQDDQVDRKTVPLVEQVADRLQGDPRRILEEGVEEAVPRAQHQAFGDRLRGIETLAHRLDQGVREFDEECGRH